jgi:hypothetical protein
VTEPNERSRGRTRLRLPVVTAVLMAASIASLVVALTADLSDSDIVLTALFLIPAVLGVLGAVLSLLHRSLTTSTRVGWAVVSAVTGLFAPLLTVMVVIQIYGF